MKCYSGIEGAQPRALPSEGRDPSNGPSRFRDRTRIRPEAAPAIKVSSRPLGRLSL